MELTPAFNLNKHIYSKIPKKHLTIPSGANTVTLLLPPEDSVIRLLGYERQRSSGASPIPSSRKRKEHKGTLLFSFEGYDGRHERTFLASYSISTKKFKVYYCGPVSTFVGATLWEPNFSEYWNGIWN